MSLNKIVNNIINTTKAFVDDDETNDTQNNSDYGLSDRVQQFDSARNKHKRTAQEIMASLPKEDQETLLNYFAPPENASAKDYDDYLDDGLLNNSTNRR